MTATMTPAEKLAMLAAAAGVSLVAAVAAYACRRRPARTNPAGDAVVMDHSAWSWRTAAAVGIAWPVGVAVVAAFNPPDDGLNWLPMLLVFAVPAALFVGLGVLLARTAISYDDGGITDHARGLTLPWADVQRVRFNMSRRLMSGFELRAADGRTVRVPAYVRNLVPFADTLVTKLDPPAYAGLGNGFRYVHARGRLYR